MIASNKLISFIIGSPNNIFFGSCLKLLMNSSYLVSVLLYYYHYKYFYYIGLCLWTSNFGLQLLYVNSRQRFSVTDSERLLS